MPYRKFAWPFSFYFFIMAGAAAYRPYLVLYYQSLSFTGAQIGLLVGLAPLITLVSLPLITGLADRANKHKLILTVCLLTLSVGLLLFLCLKTFILLLGLAILNRVCFSPIMPLADSATMFMLEGSKDLYGRIRLGGTIGFSLAAMLVGSFVQHSGLQIVFWTAAGLFLLALLVSPKLDHGGETHENVAEKGRTSELLRNPHFLLFLLIAFSGGISFATLNTYLFPYMKALGARESMMGLALTIGTISEIPVLFFVNRAIKRFDAYPLLIFSIAVTGLRFLLLAVTTNPLVVLFIQLLNGFNHPLLSVAGVTYADACAPKGLRATAQGLFTTFLGGIGFAAGGFAGGLLFEGLGARGMYLAFGLFIVLVLLVVSLVHRMLPPEESRAE